MDAPKVSLSLTRDGGSQVDLAMTPDEARSIANGLIDAADKIDLAERHQDRRGKWG